jgi:hypothetical protein
MAVTLRLNEFFASVNALPVATPRTMAVAIAVARQATVRRKAGSVPWVSVAKGKILPSRGD